MCYKNGDVVCVCEREKAWFDEVCMCCVCPSDAVYLSQRECGVDF